MKEYRDLEERYKKYLPNHTKARAQNTIDKYWKCVKQALKWKSGDPLKWTQDETDRYRAFMKKIYNRESGSPENENSLIPHCVALKHYYKMIGLEITINIPPKTETHKDTLSELEMNRIEECARTGSLRDYVIIKLLRETLLRVSDICGIDIDKVDYKNNTIKAWIKKNHKWHINDISEVTMKAIKEYVNHERINPNDNNSKALLTTSTGNRMYRSRIWEIVKIYTARAGISKTIFPHSFRTSGITQMSRRGIPDKDGMAVTGHKDSRSYQRYVQTDREQQKQAFEKGILGIDNGTKNGTNLSRPMGDIPISNEPERTPILSDETREMLLLDNLLTGRINEQTYQNALAMVRKNQHKKEVSGYR